MPTRRPTRSSTRARQSNAMPQAPSRPPETLAGMVPVRRPIRAKLEQLQNAVQALMAARSIWEESIARLDITSPMDEDYVDVVVQVERATTAYLAAGQILARTARKV